MSITIIYFWRKDRCKNSNFRSIFVRITSKNMQKDNIQRQKDNSPSKKVNNYARFSGMAFQMMGTIALGTFLGVKLDAWQQNNFPAWTLGLSLGSVAAALYLMIKQIPKE
jgi:Putative F0F1-ATPase subunit Ca2+/Mg2+ transporter